MFSAGYYSQTAPPTDLFQGPSWDTTVEGTQNFLDFPENGDPEEYALYGQVTPRSHAQDFDVKAEAASPISREAVCRQPSIVSRKNRTIKASSTKSCPRQPSTLQTSQVSYEIPGNTRAFQDGSHAAMDMPISFVDPDSHIFYQTPLSLGMPEAPVLGLVDPAQMQLDHQFDALLVRSPSETWDSVSSHGNSPRTVSDGPDDAWTVAGGSPTESHSSAPEIIQGQSRMNHNIGIVSMLPTDDLQGSVMTAVPDDFSLPPSYGSHRPTSEGETARDHPLYKEAYPSAADGLYHCPWEGNSGCTHKAEKLKCNYDKFVDSHLKPYRCKVESCENARFSSTACLLRHEREAHAMHGHGDKPYLCTYEGCDRGFLGSGFPRQWNLKDHMRRVHNDNGPASSARGTISPSSNSPKASSKGRKRKQDTDSSSTRKPSLKATSGSDSHGHGSRRSQASTLAAKQPLIEEWYEHHVALQNMVNGMTNPDSMSTLSVIRDVQDQLVHLSSLSHNLIYSHGNNRR